MKLFEIGSSKRNAAEQFEQLVQPHFGPLYQSAFKLTGSPSDAEDLLQELLIKLYTKMDEMKAVKELRPWLYRVLYNLFVDHFRKQQRNPASEANRQLLVEGDMIDTLACHDAQPELALQNQQLSDKVLKVLAELDYERRALVVLHLIEGFTLEELAVVLDAPLGTLKSRLHRVKGYLKTRLQVEPFQLNTRDKEGG